MDDRGTIPGWPSAQPDDRDPVAPLKAITGTQNQIVSTPSFLILTRMSPGISQEVHEGRSVNWLMLGLLSSRNGNSNNDMYEIVGDVITSIVVNNIS